jgi:hypothetical protein
VVVIIHWAGHCPPHTPLLIVQDVNQFVLGILLLKGVLHAQHELCTKALQLLSEPKCDGLIGRDRAFTLALQQCRWPWRALSDAALPHGWEGLYLETMRYLQAP